MEPLHSYDESSTGVKRFSHWLLSEARAAKVATMNPFKRWGARHPQISLVVLVIVVLGAVGGFAVARTQVQNRAVAEANAAAAKAAAEKAATEAKAAADIAAAEAKVAADMQRSCLLGTECVVGNKGPGGGVVFYDAGSMQPWGRYLEAAPAGWAGGSKDPNRMWCNIVDTKINGASGVEIGDGKANTDEMVNACSSGAGVMASRYAGGGKTDWYLPSKNELDAMYKEQVRVGGLGPDGYWSSSQYDSSIAWLLLSATGGQYSPLKRYENGVRPVRAI